jgi:hypothetical protein
MSSSIQTIELRQLDSQNVQANGDYEIQLSKAITIENGDIVQLKSAFIDTVRESDINIIDDLTLNIKSGVYLTNWYNWEDEVESAFLRNNSAYGDSPDFRRYIPYIGIDTGPITGYSFFLSVNFQLEVRSGFPAIPLTYSYQNYFGQTTQITVYIPAENYSTYKLISIPINVLANVATFNLISTTYPDLAKLNIFFNSYTLREADDYIYQPFTMTTTMTVPRGVYSPIQLSTFISQELSKTGLSVNVENQNMTDSKFLLSTGDFDVNKASPDGRLNPNGTPVLLTEQTKFISDDGQVLLKFKPNSNFLIGSSQIGLEFDPNSNKFQFTQIHSNMLDATSGTDISVRYLKYNFVPNGKVFGVANNGGIFFESLTAFDPNGNYVPFWESTLGFNLNSLCVGTSFSGTNIFNDDGSVFNLSNAFNVGSSITDGYYGLDSTIIRGTVAGSVSPPDYSKPYTWIFRQPVPFYNGDDPTSEIVAQAGISSTINSTVAILAEQPIDVLLNKFSHYILQTDLGFSNNDYVGVDYYKNINGIISKYYSYGSYCASETEGAIQYVHSGNSIQLKSIRVRLLTSSKLLDLNLGSDNTIILQVIKTGSQTPVLTRDVR